MRVWRRKATSKLRGGNVYGFVRSFVCLLKNHNRVLFFPYHNIDKKRTTVHYAQLVQPTTWPHTLSNEDLTIWVICTRIRPSYLCSPLRMQLAGGAFSRGMGSSSTALSLDPFHWVINVTKPQLCCCCCRSNSFITRTGKYIHGWPLPSPSH